MECGDEGCIMLRRLDKDINDDEHGLKSKCSKLRSCINKKISWTSFVVIMVTVGGPCLWVWAQSLDVTERRAIIKALQVETTEIKKDVTKNIEEISEIKKWREDDEKWKKEDRELKQLILSTLEKKRDATTQ